jgi:hypothetical protein
LLLAISWECRVGAAEDVLTGHGQDGVTIKAIAIDPVTPTTLYVGTYFGVFKSTDGVGNWSQASTGLTTAGIAALHKPLPRLPLWDR